MRNSIKIFLSIIFLLFVNRGFSQDSIRVDSIKRTNNYIIEKYSVNTNIVGSGDNQICNINDILDFPIQIIVKDSLGNPVPNFPVSFNFISYPKKSKYFELDSTVKHTDINGVATNTIKLGSKEGEYLISAKIKSLNNKNFEIFTESARKSNWIFILVISVLGGLGLFLFGMYLMSDGLQKSAGDKMRAILSRLTNNRLVALGVGTFVTMIIQSSSATTVMLVSFVNAKLMSFRKSLGIVLGAGIGTTITAQLIAFKLSEYSLLVVAIGFVFYYFTKTEKIKNIGEAIFGFGILFFGMEIMSDAMSPLRTFQPFLDLILKLENPVFGILVGMIFTALIQSSSAFIGILIILSTQGFLTIDAGIPLILGSNIGTAVTAIIASIGANREALKVALAHTFFKVFGVLIFIWWMPSFGELVVYLSPKSEFASTDISYLGEVVPRQIANAHSIFNIVLTIFALPLINQFAWFINKLLPKKTDNEDIENKTRFIDYNIVNTPSLALNLAKQETLLMSYQVQSMVRNIKEPFFEHNPKIIKEIEEKEIYVNFLRDEIKAYLIRISRYNVEENRINEAFQILYTVKELEQIADIVSTTLIKKAKSWVNHEYEFSEEGKKELQAYHLSILKQFSRAIEVFRDVNLEKAKKANEKYKKYEDFAFELEKKHFERLTNQVDKTIESSKTHIVLMDMLKQIGEHSTNIARILLKWSSKTNK